MASPNREAIKDVQSRLRAQGLCGEIFVDAWGEEATCTLPTPCERHGEAQQEPERGGEAWTEIYDALFELLGREPTWAESVIAQEAMKATLRARVQPRRVSDWRPIETAPRDGTKFLATNGTEYSDARWPIRHACGRWEKNEEGEWRGAAIWPRPTHWIPLPEPPITPEEENDDG